MRRGGIPNGPWFRRFADGRPPRTHWGWRHIAAIALSTWSALVGADIYRYQDEQGGWHFTDAPPDGVDADRILDIWETSKPRASEPIVDLAAQLERAYDPVTPTAVATLAVVTVKSAVGEASGFFCSDDGHILTHRHLVRSDASEARMKRDKVAASEEADLQTTKEQLQVAREQIAMMEKDLAGYQRVRERAKNDSSQQWAQDAYDRLLLRYRSEQEKASRLSGDLRVIGMDRERSHQNRDGGHTDAALATSFDIRLKDGTELVAELIASEARQDLALLKIEGFRTPHLRLGDTLSLSLSLSQGQRVYAIGNSPGRGDSVISGVVTQIADDYIYTDAEVLPGDSGGPLITESGVLIGINVARNLAAGESPYRVGLSKSIPVQAALKAFREALPAHPGDPITGPVTEATPRSGVPERGFTWD